MAGRDHNAEVPMRYGRVFVASMAVLTLAPASMSAAATVELAGKTAVSYGDGWAGIDYRAAPGEANHVVLSQVDDRTIGVTDSGAVIAPGRGCRSLDAHAAECTVAGLKNYLGLIGASVQAGDQDDVVDSLGPGLSANGGPGDDTLQSSSAVAGILDGGGGRDTLLGGTNTDTLTDGDTSGAADDDLMDGREGGAIVTYASRTAPVHVDLADPRPDGEPGERDTIRAATGITGGKGADDLRGDSGADHLDGGPGGDRLVGRAGDDYIDGGGGADRVVAGAGDDFVAGGPARDVLSGGDGRDLLEGGHGRDRLRGGEGADLLLSGWSWCGPGRDVASPSDNDYIAPDCEEMEFDLHMSKTEDADFKAINVKPYPSVGGAGSITFRVQCPYLETDGYPYVLPLRGALRLRSSSRVLGAGRIPDARRRCANRGTIYARSQLPWLRVPVRLSPTGRRLLSRGRALRVSVDFFGRNVPPIPWRITLRAA